MVCHLTQDEALDGPQQFVSFLTCFFLAYPGVQSASEGWDLAGPKQFFSFLTCLIDFSRWSDS
jgi:hypothetical protein